MDTRPTAGQLERSLSQQIQALYREELGHCPKRIICQLFESKLAIILEGSITQPEKFLANDGQKELAGQVRDRIDEAIRPQLKDLVEEVLGVPVVDILSDATLETERTGLIVVLDEIPTVRNANSIPKVKLPNSQQDN
ncbi:MAG: DUF2294 domain-containing protein [Thainema sp.]